MINKNVSLKDYSNYKIGGNASYFLEVFSKEDLIEGLKNWYEVSSDFPTNSKKIFVLGGGTNVLFSDYGFYGLVIKNSINGIKAQDNIVTVGAGEVVSSLLNFCIKNSLSGLEWAGGLPGTVGGAVRGNAGAFRGETKDSVSKVESIDLESFQTKTRNNKECNFSYRNSVFKIGDGDKEMIVSVILNLKKGEKGEIKKITDEKINYRKEKHPLEYPNIGSIFKNVEFNKLSKNLKEEFSQYIKQDPFPVVPSAKIIFLAGLKGRKIGDAGISEKHTNFIVNLGNAKSKDVLKLIKFAKEQVFEKFGISLEEEIMYVGSA